MEKKIFNDFGFLSKEGKAFVDDGFTKEVRRVFATATSQEDILVISSILKSIVGEQSSSMYREWNKSSNEPSSKLPVTKNDGRLIRPEQHKQAAIQLPAADAK